jgi:hypothetical protein
VIIGSENESREDDENFGGNNIEKRNGEGNHMGSSKQARIKRKATQDEEPVNATKSKKKKLNGSEGHPVATQSTKKAPKKSVPRKENKNL